MGRWVRLNGSQAFDWIEFTQDGRFIVSDEHGERVRLYYAVQEKGTAVLIGSSGGGPDGVQEWALETDGAVLFSPFLKGNYKKA